MPDPTPADVLRAYYGSEGFPVGEPDPNAPGWRDMLERLRPRALDTVPLAQPSGGAFGTQMPQEIAPATTAGSLVSAPQTMADIVKGAATHFGETAKRMTEASGRQEIDPQANVDMIMQLYGTNAPFMQAGAAGVFGGRIGAERLAAAGKPEALNALPKAEQMLAAGAAPEEIHAATGWAPDAAGKLSFEIPDYGTGFRPMAPLPQGTGVEGQLSPFIGGPIGKPGREMLAEHAYSHPDLFTAYPELARYAMKFEDPVKREGFLFKGGADPVNKDFYLNPEAFAGPGGREAMRSTMLHEFQHPVQAIEGFPSGGSPNMPEVRQAADAAIAQRTQNAQTRLDNLYAQRDAYVESQLQAGRHTDDPTILSREFWQVNPEAVKEAAQAHIQIETANVFRNSEIVKQYKGVAGEVQARNVQARADIPPEQLKDLPPSYTQDTPNSQQLLRFSDPATGYHMDEPSFTERMAALKDAAFQRAQKGTATGDYGLGTARRTAPDAPKGTFERFAAEQRAGFQGDTARAIDEYRAATGQQPKGRAKPLLAPGERPEDLYFSGEPKPTTEMTPIGEQYVLPGAEKASEATMAQRLSDLALKPKVPQKPADIGLFGDEGKQGLLFDTEHLGPVTGVGRPYISEANRPLFDYSRLSDVPNVPQFNLPRVNPPEGVPESATKVATPSNIARVNKAVQAGESMGGREWYNTEPLRESFVSELGDAKGNAAFRQYMEMVAANSPRTRVPENIRNASYFYGTEARGEPLPRTYLEGGYHRMVKSTQAPSPYGVMPIHVQNMENLRQGGLPVLQNPKPASFVENLTGNQTPVTIDTHNMRLLTRARDAEVPKANEYGFLENLQQEQAAKMGMSPAQYQASAWLGAGKETGLASPVEPFLRTLESRIEKTAEVRGLTKAEVLRQFIRGQAPLLSLTPAAVLAGQGQPAQEQAQ